MNNNLNVLTIEHLRQFYGLLQNKLSQELQDVSYTEYQNILYRLGIAEDQIEIIEGIPCFNITNEQIANWEEQVGGFEYAQALGLKLDTIEEGANVNVQPDFNQTDQTADDYIKNKPTLSTVAVTGSYDDLLDTPEKITAATDLKDGLMTKGDKLKLDRIEEEANNYTHPSYTPRELTFYKVAIDGAGHVHQTSRVTKEDITNLGIPAQDTTYSLVSPANNKNGLMSVSDKNKLDNIEATAQVNKLEKIKIDNVEIAITNKTANIPLSDLVYDLIPNTVSGSSVNGNIIINGQETQVYRHPAGTNPHNLSKSDIGLGNVENKTSEQIINEITKEDITSKLTSQDLINKLGFTPIAVSQKGINNGVATLDSDGIVPLEQLPESIESIVVGYYSQDSYTFFEDSEHTKAIAGATRRLFLDIEGGGCYIYKNGSYICIAKKEAVSHISNTSNPHNVTKSQLGLGNVNNTSDEDKPLSAAARTAHSNLSSAISQKVDKVNGKGLSSNDFTDEDKRHLDAIVEQDFITQINYNGSILSPSSGSVNISTSEKANKTQCGYSLEVDKDNGRKIYLKDIYGNILSTIYTQDTDTNTTYNLATQGSNGLMSYQDKIKLDAVELEGYTHPTHPAHSSALYKVEIDGFGHVCGATLATKADITGLGIPGTDTTYSAATTTVDGLMSKEDKTKLNNLISNFNNYVLPTASSSQLGGIKVGTNLSIDSNGVLSASDHTYSAATHSANGLMTSADKVKLDNIGYNALSDDFVIENGTLKLNIEDGNNLTY